MTLYQQAKSTFRLAFILFIMPFVFSACTTTAPYRPYVQTSTSINGCNTVVPGANTERITPEISQDPSYTLHYLEFDDQGWMHSGASTSAKDTHWSPGLQIDCAIGDLARKVEAGNVRAFVFVHGWHHSADNNDRDLRRFRQLLADQARAESRQVVGFYIGWRGETLTIPYLRDLTIWGRKNAAHHISEGSIREFFSRIKALRNHYNRRNVKRSENCGEARAIEEGFDCPLRTVMIGHSLGAWILYSATSPYILETLAGDGDLPPDAKLPHTYRERGVADLIILLNAAFEATRYEPVYRAAKRYKPKAYETPLLVSVTSTADGATGTAFPLMRTLNTIFQYPSPSDAENEAMLRTHGHLDPYITHELTIDKSRASTTTSPRSCIDAQNRQSDRDTLRKRFFESARQSNGKLKLGATWQREMCGGLTLKSLGGRPDNDPYNVVWNVRTHKDVIPGHNEIVEPPLYDFMEQIYGDLRRAPEWEVER